MDTTKYISVPGQTRRDLRKIFQCTREMVWQALNYRSDSDLARKIRKAALERGGTECDPGKQNFKIL